MKGEAHKTISRLIYHLTFSNPKLKMQVVANKDYERKRDNCQSVNMNDLMPETGDT